MDGQSLHCNANISSQNEINNNMKQTKIKQRKYTLFCLRLSLIPGFEFLSHEKQHSSNSNQIKQLHLFHKHHLFFLRIITNDPISKNERLINISCRITDATLSISLGLKY